MKGLMGESFIIVKREVKRHAGLVAFAFIILLGAFPLEGKDPQELQEVVVSSQRPMAEIGLQQTKFDSLALKENIALTMADILAYNSSLYVKSGARGSLATVAFRGTGPSHTQVTWNGIRINSPMLGMTDFSTIPAYFIDTAELLHGSSSVGETGGGLGGTVVLGTVPDVPRGWNLQYVQGIGSFSTFDEFLKVGFANKHLTVLTRAAYMSSPNDYTYINHDKKENIYDDNHNIIGQYYPKEKNKSGAYKDLHILQEVFYNTLRGDRFGLNAWYADSNRELPLLTTDYGDERKFENKQQERIFRGVVSWSHSAPLWRTEVKGGYIYSWMAYNYRREITGGQMATLTRSRSKANTIMVKGEWEYQPSNVWSFGADVNFYQQILRSETDNIIKQDGNKAVVGYDKARPEGSASITARWQPVYRLGLAFTLREELNGNLWSEPIPAFFIDGILTRDGRLTAKASVSRNFRAPTLNDLYFLPGGNPELQSEKGTEYDAGLTYKWSHGGIITVQGEVTWFDSFIKDWIIWLPTTKGFFSPRNMQKVHAYGVEIKSEIGLHPLEHLFIDLHGSYSWTPSINTGAKMSEADKSVGRQLPYIPEHTATITGRLTWKTWSFLYKWCYYSERYTMSSNDYTISGHLTPYFMSNVSLQKDFEFRPLNLQLKLAVNNLFNEDYLSILSRPMPGINFELFIGITPKF